ncbi:MAG TPA: alpha-amylase family glycosyl hydrolase [Polyangiaceae bacterium]|nr:alpha-amylase family glycosyl hydrolase [Polyangiaceae bacterium]
MSGQAWWQRGIVYQIYPRSFADSNGDGVGDLRGILERVGYLAELGVDAVWISPIYPSPMADFGYDVSNYTDVHPLFGSLDDLRELVRRVHALGMKLILDFVPNHTSNEHPWFLEAKSSRTNDKRQFYLWQDAKPDGSPPNNWLSVFGGSAWTWDETTGQYYYHAFLPEQPDLNWRHPEVRRQMYAAMRFWLELGVDGFRVDVLWHLIKDAEWRDNPPNPDYRAGEPPYTTLLPAYSTDQPEVFEIVREMRRVVEEYDERVLIGEIYLPISRLVSYYGAAGDGAHLPFNFQLIVLPWRASDIAAAISEYEAALPPGAWPNWVLGNHDQARIASRIGLRQARVAAMLLLTLRGTPTLYYGDELGLHDVPILPEQYRDPQGKNIGLSRDPARTPMQWSAAPSAGFTTGTPWLPVADDYEHVNVERELADPDSMLALYRRLIALRRSEPAFVAGSYRPVIAGGDIVAYTREHDGRRWLVALNLGGQPAELSLAALGATGEIVVATSRQRQGQRVAGQLALAGDDGVLVRLEST